MASIPIIVNIAPEGGADLQSVAGQLRAQGMEVSSVLDFTHQIIGTVPDEGKLAGLQQVPGVTVERDQPVQIAPPDAPVQ
jgi:hypothetical protein